MKLHEIPQDASVLLEISKEKSSREVRVEIDHIMNKGVMLKPIVVDDMILNPEGSDARLSLIYERQGEKPLIWRNVSYGVFRQDNRPHVVLSDKRDGAEHNRRASFRLDMDIQGTLNRSDSVIIHDVSKTGISFYTSHTQCWPVGTFVVISFRGGYEELTVTGKVVRQQVEEDRVLHGCALKANPQLDQFISDEQVRRLRKHR